MLYIPASFTCGSDTQQGAWQGQPNYLHRFLGRCHRARHRCSQPDTSGTITSSLPAITRKQARRDMSLISGHGSISLKKEQARCVTWGIHALRCFDQRSLRRAKQLEQVKVTHAVKPPWLDWPCSSSIWKGVSSARRARCRYLHPACTLGTVLSRQLSLGSADWKARMAVKSDVTNKKNPKCQLRHIHCHFEKILLWVRKHSCNGETEEWKQPSPIPEGRQPAQSEVSFLHALQEPVQKQIATTTTKTYSCGRLQLADNSITTSFFSPFTPEKR